MKSVRFLIASLIVLGFMATFVNPVDAQPRRPPPRPPGPPIFRPPLPPPPRPPLPPPRPPLPPPFPPPRPPRPIFIAPPLPVVVERPVYVETPTTVTVVTNTGDHYSSKLGATFVIQNMQIPGYRFTAARLTSTPQEGSPLETLGLRKGDVITRLNDESVNSLAVLERYEGSTAVRYIRTGTTRVRLGTIYIPTNSQSDSDGFVAP